MNLASTIWSWGKKLTECKHHINELVKWAREFTWPWINVGWSLKLKERCLFQLFSNLALTVSAFAQCMSAVRNAFYREMFTKLSVMMNNLEYKLFNAMYRENIACVLVIYWSKMTSCIITPFCWKKPVSIASFWGVKDQERSLSWNGFVRRFSQEKCASSLQR